MVSLLIRGFVNPKEGEKGGQHCPRYINTRSIKLKLSILAQGSKDSNALYSAVDKDKRIKNNRRQQGIWVFLGLITTIYTKR